MTARSDGSDAQPRTAHANAALPVHPDLERFAALARSGQRIVPVWTAVVGDQLTPVGAFAAMVGDGTGFLLESVEGGERWGRHSFVGRRPLATVTARGTRVVAEGQLGVPTDGAPGILAVLERLLADCSAPVLPDLPPLQSGVVGYLGYDVVREIERLPNPPPDDLGHPDAVLGVIGQLAAFDHWLQRVVLIDNVLVDPAWSREEIDRAYSDAAARLAELACDCFSGTGAPSRPVAMPERPAPAVANRTMAPEAYRDAVAAAKDHIDAGDIFQVVLSQRFDVKLGVDPFDVYRALRLLNPSPYLYFLRFEEVTVVGSSPEPMVRLRDGVVTSRPIAGSPPRGAGDEQDRLLAAQLVEDPKELAEHVMLVDLARNDVGRVVEYGTEHVDELMTVERYSHIMHLTSQVSGRLRGELGPVDVLRATFPAGTLSGAPKVRAMEIIDDLEPTKRGVYGGVVGYLDFSGNLDTAIAIRTMVVGPGGRASVQAGAGIVADSDPVTEDEECRHKAAALLAAVTAAGQLGSVGSAGTS
ncbi:MAG TPA: chorismate-binding protein [Acidimicrobiales bacterium]|nr:chorismate-binding protein [Acidimicrobiales bacterium]